ncbi:hypothetical protein EX30DRAFT_344266 [Ascodesmis nigricans]|uniref:Uncharacterized protein n=1 Tax=Ascodesmis nigricans TaxID=341454 RepID=A0A4S2MJZ8_9PEZI|nr:hypothetical protein EX30DRAFT_344266 [Ascodesmis nigricans]
MMSSLTFTPLLVLYTWSAAIFLVSALKTWIRSGFEQVKPQLVIHRATLRYPWTLH